MTFKEEILARLDRIEVKQHDLRRDLKSVKEAVLTLIEIGLDIRDRINDLPTKDDLGRAKRSIVKDIREERRSSDELGAPLNEVRRQQVRDVKIALFNAYQNNQPLSLNAACQQVWRPLTGGYPSPKALYEYCHAHKDEF